MVRYSYRVRKRFINISVRNGLHPLLREDGKFDKDLSDIITLDDINGDIHMHTTYSDGVFLLEI